MTSHLALKRASSFSHRNACFVSLHMVSLPLSSQGPVGCVEAGPEAWARLCPELVAALTGEACLASVFGDGLGAAAGRGPPQPDLSLLSHRTLPLMCPRRTQLSPM